MQSGIGGKFCFEKWFKNCLSATLRTASIGVSRTASRIVVKSGGLELEVELSRVRDLGRAEPSQGLEVEPSESGA